MDLNFIWYSLTSCEPKEQNWPTNNLSREQIF
jgi:hypothetical protein